MKRFWITTNEAPLGEYLGETAEAAREVMAVDYGFATFSEMCEVNDRDREEDAPTYAERVRAYEIVGS